jgi:hypothetical protein
MDPPIITKVWYLQTSDGARHFSLDSDNRITDSTILGVNNGDHLLWFNKVDFRGHGDDHLIDISIGIKPKALVFITVLKAGNFPPEYLRYLLHLVSWTRDATAIIQSIYCITVSVHFLIMHP